MSNRIVKLAHHVSFPMELDLSKLYFCGTRVRLGALNGLNCISTLSYTQEICDDIGIAKGLASLSSSCSPLETQRKQHSNYVLKAVVVHHGNAFEGHFTAYRRLDGRLWVHISDGVVNRVSEDEVNRAQAYMLFYER
jgi:hypothetical protein